jgi:hypothetical protein
MHYTHLETEGFVALHDVKIDLEILVRHLCSPDKVRPILDRELTMQELSEIYNAAWNHDHLRDYLRQKNLIRENDFVERVQLLDRNRRSSAQPTAQPTPLQRACCYMILFAATTGVFAVFYGVMDVRQD